MQNDKKKELRRLDIQWRDTLILNDGRVVHVVDTLDDIIKAVTKDGTTVYIRRFQVKSHYPTNERAL
jgi:hypothetical protein